MKPQTSCPICGKTMLLIKTRFVCDSIETDNPHKSYIRNRRTKNGIDEMCFAHFTFKEFIVAYSYGELFQAPTMAIFSDCEGAAGCLEKYIYIDVDNKAFHLLSDEDVKNYLLLI